jgi:hypothetical protein
MVDYEQKALFESEGWPYSNTLKQIRRELGIQTADIIPDRTAEVVDVCGVLTHPHNILCGALRVGEM